MARALLTLVAGIVGALFVALILTVNGIGAEGFLLVLLTVLVGGAVMVAVVRRTIVREREQRLRDPDESLTDMRNDHQEEPDRG
jgi:hypothetical protein